MVDLAPLKVTLPDYPFVGALALTLRDEQNQRFAANFVNLVVKPEHPLPRIQRRGPKMSPSGLRRRILRSHEWSDPAKAPAGKVYGHGKGLFRVPDRASRPRLSKPIPSQSITCFKRHPRPRTERADWPAAGEPPRLSAVGHDAHLASTLVVSLNGRAVDRIDLPDDAADARGVLSHLAKVEHGSHGELVDGKVDAHRSRSCRFWPPASRSFFVWPSHRNAPAAGGLCIFGASTGELPLDPTLEIHTRDPLPADLGVDPNVPVAVPCTPLKSRGLVGIEELFAVASQEPVGVNAGQLDEAQNRMSRDRVSGLVVVQSPERNSQRLGQERPAVFAVQCDPNLANSACQVALEVLPFLVGKWFFHRIDRPCNLEPFSSGTTCGPDR